MIPLYLALLQAIAPLPGAAPARTAVDALEASDGATAVEAFKAICTANVRDVDAFHAAIAASPLVFRPAGERGPGQPAEVWRSERAIVSYVPAGGKVTQQCSLRARVAGGANQLVFAGRVATALALGEGRTRTATDQSSTEWTGGRRGNRIRVIATTVPNAQGAELRLAAIAAVDPTVGEGR